MANSRNLSDEDVQSLQEELAKSNEMVGIERLERGLAAIAIAVGWVAIVASLIWGDRWWLEFGLIAFVGGLWVRSSVTNSRLQRAEFVLALHLHEGTKKVQ